MALSIGQPVPDFTLYDSDKNKVSLHDLRGKNVVLLFFPMAYTGTCTKEMCEMRDNYSAYGKLNAEVLGISVDTVFTLAKFKEANNLNFRLLSDFNKETVRAYDVYLEDFSFDYHGVAKRSVFLIDKDGILRYSEVLPKPGDYPNMPELKSAVESLAA